MGAVAVVALLSIVVARTATATVIEGPIASPVNGHLYYLLSGATWTDSEAEAVGLAGHLATIRSQAENDWVFDTFSPLANADFQQLLWIGLSDATSPGTFAWASGEPVTYTNWYAGQPDNIGTEHYVHMVGPTGPPTPGTWNNNLNTIPANGVVEVIAQLKPTKMLLVKNPPSGPAARTIIWRVNEPASSNTVVGDPTADGAKLRIRLSPGGDLCVNMPASGWSAIGMLGFKYVDPSLANGPVKVASIKKTSSGTFQIRAILKGSGITAVPGNPTSTYSTNLKLGAGDEYCSGSATATPRPNGDKTFKVVNDTAPTACSVAACSP